jgi:hypothetical protein
MIVVLLWTENDLVTGQTRLDSTRLDSTRLDSTRLDSTRLDSTRLFDLTHSLTQLITRYKYRTSYIR